MNKLFSGYCPEQGKDFSIKVTYIPNSDFDRTCYEKGTFSCSNNPFGTSCKFTDCPIYNSAPNTL